MITVENLVADALYLLKSILKEDFNQAVDLIDLISNI